MNSPFQHRLNSNYTPSEDECHRIAQIVTEQDERISRMDEEIHRLHLLLQPLLRDRGNVHAFREAHRQLLSPSRRIPPEIWSEVFVHCLPAGKFVEINVREAPMLLAQVSSLWRSIVLSTPRLWNSISVGG
jgi:F-box-like